MVEGHDTKMDNTLKEKYAIKSVIGKGTCTIVKKGKNLLTNEAVAIKIISKKKTAKDKV